MKIVAEHIVIEGFTVFKVYEAELLVSGIFGGVVGYDVPHKFYFKKNGDFLTPLTTDEFVKMRNRYEKILLNDINVNSLK